MSIRQDEGFDVPEVRKVIDHTALVLTDIEGSRGPDGGGSGADQETGPPGSEGKYCRVITPEGKRRLNKAQYETLIKNRASYDMFIDGTRRDASFTDAKGEMRSAKLTPKEFGMLSEYIQSAMPMRPRSTTTGRECASSAAACKVFAAARRKVDLKLARYEYRSFCLRKDPSNPDLKTYEFAPSDQLKYCLILPI
jgi:hypothetical protein